MPTLTPPLPEQMNQKDRFGYWQRYDWGLKSLCTCFFRRYVSDYLHIGSSSSAAADIFSTSIPISLFLHSNVTQAQQWSVIPYQIEDSLPVFVTKMETNKRYFTAGSRGIKVEGEQYSKVIPNVFKHQNK